MQNHNQETQTPYIQQYQANDLTGKKFGMLTAVEPTPDRYYNSIVWLCRCDCGNEVVRSASQLKSGVKLSCGCMKRETEGQQKERMTRVAGTTVEFLKSTRLRSDSTTGVRGVNRFKDRYRAKIYFQGRNYSLGVYQTIEEAAAVRKEAENCLYGNFLDFYDKWKEKADADPDWGKENPVSVSVDRDAVGRFHVSMQPDLAGTGDSHLQAELTISDYCVSWLKRQEGNLLPSSWRQYRSIINSRIMPAIGMYRPSQLSKDKLDHMMEAERHTLSAGSLLATRGVLRALLEYIAEEAPGQLPDSGVIGSEYAKEKLPLDDQITILNVLTTDMDLFRLGVFLALMTGMSVGEICALRWRDIIFIWHQIKIENNLRGIKTDGKKQYKMEPTKRLPDNRVLPMTRLTTAYCKKLLPGDKEAYVMTGTREPMLPWTVNYRFRKLMKECDLMYIHFDDLHDGFPEADVDMDFEDPKLNEVLKKNLERKKTSKPKPRNVSSEEKTGKPGKDLPPEGAEMKPKHDSGWTTKSLELSQKPI